MDEIEDSNKGVQAAIEDTVGTTQVTARYLVGALALAVAWWQTAGAMSAWVTGIGLVVLSFAAPRAIMAVSSLRWPKAEGVIIESEVLTEGEVREYANLATAAGG